MNWDLLCLADGLQAGNPQDKIGFGQVSICQRQIFFSVDDAGIAKVVAFCDNSQKIHCSLYFEFSSYGFKDTAKFCAVIHRVINAVAKQAER